MRSWNAVSIFDSDWSVLRGHNSWTREHCLVSVVSFSSISVDGSFSINSLWQNLLLGLDHINFVALSEQFSIDFDILFHRCQDIDITCDL